MQGLSLNPSLSSVVMVLHESVSGLDPTGFSCWRNARVFQKCTSMEWGENVKYDRWIFQFVENLIDSAQITPLCSRPSLWLTNVTRDFNACGSENHIEVKIGYRHNSGCACWADLLWRIRSVVFLCPNNRLICVLFEPQLSLAISRNSIWHTDWKSSYFTPALSWGVTVRMPRPPSWKLYILCEASVRQKSRWVCVVSISSNCGVITRNLSHFACTRWPRAWQQRHIRVTAWNTVLNVTKQIVYTLTFSSRPVQTSAVIARAIMELR